jgi:pyruvate-ferredoxin/flavodoxin oxidoreductase
MRAVECRAFPLFTFDPDREGVFGSRLDLAGNPDDAARLTLADWAVTEGRFAACFAPLEESDPAPTPLVEFLATEAGKRANQTPYVTIRSKAGDSVAGEAGEDREETETRLRVLPAMVAVAEDRLHSWRMLQELAGVVTPFTARIQQEVERAVAEEHKTELEALEQEYESRLQSLRAEVEQEFTQRLQKRLTQLAQHRNRLGVN